MGCVGVSGWPGVCGSDWPCVDGSSVCGCNVIKMAVLSHMLLKPSIPQR